MFQNVKCVVKRDSYTLKFFLHYGLSIALQTVFRNSLLYVINSSKCTSQQSQISSQTLCLIWLFSFVCLLVDNVNLLIILIFMVHACKHLTPSLPFSVFILFSHFSLKAILKQLHELAIDIHVQLCYFPVTDIRYAMP